MRYLIFALVLLSLTPSTTFSDPVFGVWKTTQDDKGHFGHIEIRACDQKICGILVKSFDASGKVVPSDLTGARIIWDMENKGSGSYENGKIYAPDRDKTYTSKLQLNGNSLKISGCIAFICRDGGIWARVK